MKIPDNTNVFDLPLSTVWRDTEGVFYSIGKKQPQGGPTTDEIRTEIAQFKSITGGNKVCIIMESTASAETPEKEKREVIANELASVIKALAIIVNSPLSRMLANIFFTLKPPPYPLRMFGNSEEAKEWIKQYL